MTSNISTTRLKENYASADVSEVLLHTIEIYHPLIITPIRLVKDYNNLTATLEALAPNSPNEEVTFTAAAINVELPKISTSSQSEMIIDIDNADLTIFEQTRDVLESTENLKIIYRPYLSNDLSQPCFNPPLKLNVAEIHVTTNVLQLRARFFNFSNKIFPGKTYDLETFPSLIE